MSDTVIRVENLGKKYIIGHQQQERYTALRDVITNKVKSIGSLINPKAKNENPAFEEFWALKDVSFDIKQGDRVGIIGRNGAGKSTLLKILSRITEPTTGSIKIKGRVASLLEVGTGFHPELTGRENIFLNGAILGMGKEEIKRKFDEIVAFAEVEKFLDTPVKRYSSGMYVRLAFAVAAHLEPEILIVDEVLAVGDAAFQKKCLGKMEDVAEKEGRTVLFVSHNMSSITKLCTTSLWLHRGEIKAYSETKKVVQSYFSEGIDNKAFIEISPMNQQGSRILSMALSNENKQKTTNFSVHESFFISITYKVEHKLPHHRIGVTLLSIDGYEIFTSCSEDPIYDHSLSIEPGLYIAEVEVPRRLIASGEYVVSCSFDVPGIKVIDVLEHVVKLTIEGNPFPRGQNRSGLLVYPFNWMCRSIENPSEIL
jgi:lipopolysaccharide transport system ATP-binding protein